MFDELDKNNPVPQANSRPLNPAEKPLTAKTEDIFASIEKNVKPEIFKPAPDKTPPPYGTVMPSETGWKNNKMMVFGLLFGGLLVIVAGGYFGLRLAIKGNQTIDNTIDNSLIQQETKNVEAIPEVPQAATSEIQNTASPIIEPVNPGPTDTDLDGLTDEEETVIGTGITNSDTDLDGLTDREEAKVYKTNPINPDTDGDGYKDGEEVGNGYNPNGSGKLLDINQAIK
jgi:hypothetical protein